MDETCSSKETSAKGRKKHQWVVAQELDDFFQSPDKENHFYRKQSPEETFLLGKLHSKIFILKIEFWR